MKLDACRSYDVSVNKGYYSFGWYDLGVQFAGTQRGNLGTNQYWLLGLWKLEAELDVNFEKTELKWIFTYFSIVIASRFLRPKRKADNLTAICEAIF
jgi:hypothetical protein